MTSYRKRPIVVEAEQWTGSNWPTMLDFIVARGGDAHTHTSMNDRLVIHTLEGTLLAEPGDWVVRGVEGEYYPVKNSVFQKTYEPVGGSR